MMNKPRLIDANELFEKLGEAYGIPDDWDGGIDEACEIAFDLVQNAPTAYNVEGVVEQLEEISYYAIFQNKTTDIVMDANKAIEIVKGGLDGSRNDSTSRQPHKEMVKRTSRHSNNDGSV